MDWKVSNRSGTFIARGAADSWDEARREAMERLSASSVDDGSFSLEWGEWLEVIHISEIVDHQIGKWVHNSKPIFSEPLDQRSLGVPGNGPSICRKVSIAKKFIQ